MLSLICEILAACTQDTLELSLEQKAAVVLLVRRFRQQKQELQARQQWLHQSMVQVSFTIIITIIQGSLFTVILQVHVRACNPVCPADTYCDLNAAHSSDHFQVNRLGALHSAQ